MPAWLRGCHEDGGKLWARVKSFYAGKVNSSERPGVVDKFIKIINLCSFSPLKSENSLIPGCIV